MFDYGRDSIWRSLRAARRAVGSLHWSARAGGQMELQIYATDTLRFVPGAMPLSRQRFRTWARRGPLAAHRGGRFGG